jgi:F-type H+-transporting ATPase subunit gamma
MASARDIQRRIRSVKNIAKVTGALETVAASRVRRAQAQALATRAYARAALAILADIGQRSGGVLAHPLLQEREEVKNIAVVLLTSDRGLAGPYNTNVVREAIDFEKSQSVPVQYITIGKKGRDLMMRRGARIIAEFSDLPAQPAILDITAITRTVVDDFLNGQVDEVYIAYTDFVNTLRQEPRVLRLLPLKPQDNESAGEPTEGPRAIYEFEPNAEAILDEILPRFTELVLYQSLLEALASEHSARMVAMRNATDNANALVDDLTLVYNKARQLAITSDLLDIVGGVEALGKAQAIKSSAELAEARA